MRTKLLFIPLMAAVSVISGCISYGYARFYPAKGPLAVQTPLPVFTAKVGGNGDISLVFADGEVCKGRWIQVARQQGPGGETAANTSRTNGMIEIWDTVYGQGFYVSHVLGAWTHRTAVLTGNKGTVLNVEFFYGGERIEGRKGVAKDNKDNIYKLVF